jgi:UDP-3-O-[3-hydroxymyristoyl] N-acetylglucosamine deacetylase
MPMTVVAGTGLHTGKSAIVRLSAHAGPVRLRAGSTEALLDQLTVTSTHRATTVEAKGGGLRVAMVEHLFAALAGLGVREGIAIDVEGPEMPLLDGASRAWCDALESVPFVPGPPRIRVARPASIHVGRSRYEFLPSEGVHVGVRIELDDSRLETGAFWAGSHEDFRARIAPARTFALARDLEDFLRDGLARRVAPESVVVLGEDAIHCAGPSFLPDEPARHKLLDLLGDAYLHGGPPLGRLHAFRPGHTANVQAFREAREQGVLVRCG